MTFKPGDKVKFPGMKVGKLDIKPVEGELALNDSNTSVKGVMVIKGDTQRMMFLPDGSIYCHGQHGIMLQLVELPTEVPVEIQAAIESLNAAEVKVEKP